LYIITVSVIYSNSHIVVHYLSAKLIRLLNHSVFVKMC